MLHTNQKEKQERICSNPKCKELGEKLKKLENIWINNHFYISNKDIEKVIKT